MIKDKNKIKNIWIYFVVCFVFFPSISLAEYKIGAGTINLSDIMEHVEERYNLDQDVLRKNQKKTIAPEVQIYFNNTSPEEGDVVTAVASPMYFKNSPENLYYTWYLVHTDENGDPVDSNGDCEHVTLNSAKLEAMSIAARGSFDAHLFGVDYDTAVDNDNDGVDLPMGGIGGSGKAIPHDEYVKILQKDKDRRFIYNGFFFEPNYRKFENEYYIDIKKQILDARYNTGVFERYYGSRHSEFLKDDDIGKDVIIVAEHEFANIDPSYNEPGFLQKKPYFEDLTFKTGDGDFGIKEEEAWGTDPNNPDTDGDGILDEADVAGLAQKKFTWTYRKGDRVGVVVEGTSNIPINEGTLDTSGDEASPLNNYYKIMFARPGVCDPIKTSTVGDYYGDVNYLEGDGCAIRRHGRNADYRQRVRSCGRFFSFLEFVEIIYLDSGPSKYGSSLPEAYQHYGFQYAKTIPVAEEAIETPQVTLDYSPENPQFFDDGDEEISDWLNLRAIIHNDSYNEDYLYYTWQFYKCDGEDFDNCTDSSNKISEDDIQSKSYFQGQGINNLKIKFKKSFINALDDGSQFIKATLLTQRFRGDKYKSIEEVLVPLSKNPLRINFYKTYFDEGSESWKLGDGICRDGIYRHVCPVYPGQVIMAEVDDLPAGSNYSYSWYLGESRYYPVKTDSTCPFDDIGGESFCNLSESTNFVYFPVKDFAKSQSNISVLVKGSGDYDESNYFSKRIFAVDNPSLVISKEDTDDLLQLISKDSYSAFYGDEVKFTALKTSSSISNEIPSYLSMDSWSYLGDGDLKINSDDNFSAYWTFNGRKIDDNFMIMNSGTTESLDFNIEEAGNISFNIFGSSGSSMNIGLFLTRTFSELEKDKLGETWGLFGFNNLTKETSVKVKIAYNEEAEGVVMLKTFLASTLKNSPAYSILVFKLVASLILLFAVIYFYLNFAIKR